MDTGKKHFLQPQEQQKQKNETINQESMSFGMTYPGVFIKIWKKKNKSNNGKVFTKTISDFISHKEKISNNCVDNMIWF